MTPGQRLAELERRLDAMDSRAYACTLDSDDLRLLGIPTNHKRRRYIAWARRKINEARGKIAARIAASLTK